MQRVSNLVTATQDTTQRNHAHHQDHVCTYAFVQHSPSQKTFVNSQNQSEPRDHFPRARIRRPYV